MLYRALLLLITGLFITMWTLLIRSEVKPSGNGLSALPVEHVLREVFRDGKPSTLIIHDGTRNIGDLRLSGHPEAADGTRTLEFSGGVRFTLPAGNLQRSSWTGELVAGPDWQIRSFSLNADTREITAKPSLVTHLEFTLTPPNQTAAYVLKAGNAVVDERTFKTDEAGLSELLDQFGVDETWRKQFHLGHTPKPVVTARQASLLVDHMKLETYLLTCMLNGQTLIEAHISQLGEVLQARTLFGWTLDVR